MTAKVGLWGGLAAFMLMLLLPPPAQMPAEGWATAAVIVLMASWWMTQALPLTVTAFLPFLLLPLLGVKTATETASAYYSPILFLFLGGSMIAVAIERTGLHRRFALAVVNMGGTSAAATLLAFMVATAFLSMIVSNTATALIMTPVAVAVIRAAGIKEGETGGFAGALILSIAFSATIGGFGTLVGSPTNAVAANIIDRLAGIRIDFLSWLLFGLPLVLVTIPVVWLILYRVQRVTAHEFDSAATRAAIGQAGPWMTAEKRLVPLVCVIVAGWLTAPLVEPYLPEEALSDGAIAMAGALLLFIIPDGTGRALLNWDEANRVPWGLLLLFGSGLALAEAITSSGLTAWIAIALTPLGGVPLIIIALVLVALVIVISEFASNMATVTSMLPIVVGLSMATGADPILLTVPVAIAASWGFMLPSCSGPNAIAWGTGHVALPRLLKAGFILDLCAPFLIVGVVWTMHALTS